MIDDNTCYRCPKIKWHEGQCDESREIEARGGTMSEEQVLRLIQCESDGCMYEVGRDDQDQPQYVMAKDYDKLIASLAQSEAERERLQGRITISCGRQESFKRRAQQAESALARERERNQRIRTAGQRMSNLLYNLSQQKRFIEPDAALMKDSVDEWDAAKAPAPVVTGEGQ